MNTGKIVCPTNWFISGMTSIKAASPYEVYGDLSGRMNITLWNNIKYAIRYKARTTSPGIKAISAA